MKEQATPAPIQIANIFNIFVAAACENGNVCLILGQ